MQQDLIAGRLEAITLRLKAITSRLQVIATRCLLLLGLKHPFMISFPALQTWNRNQMQLPASQQLISSSGCGTLKSKVERQIVFHGDVRCGQQKAQVK